MLTTLPTDEPLVLVMPPKTSTPIPAVADSDPLALPSTETLINNKTTVNNISSMVLDDGFTITDVSSKQSRKQKRKDKHKNKHNLSSDTERSLSKEHKRKRKKKQHDIEAPNDTTAGIPKIKIKFKTLPLPGEVTPEAQFFYVSADMVRSADEASRPGSVETIEDLTPSILQDDPASTTPKINITPPRPHSVNTVMSKSSTNPPSVANVSPVKTVISPRKSSPRKSMMSRTSLGASYGGPSTSGSRPKAPAHNANQILTCCVCHANGTSTNMVTCDECRKHYHFTCLDPPLKKSPKIRGYSWHCADCDPTDEEKH